MRRGASLVTGGIVLAIAALALDEELYPSIIGNDDRTPIDVGGAPWEAVGKLNISGYRLLTFCSGVLVAPNVVLTAAHCLYDPWKSEPFDPSRIHFVAAQHGSDNKGTATARCIRTPTRYEFVAPRRWFARKFVQRVELKAFKNDVAAVILDKKLDATPAQVMMDRLPTPGAAIDYASYHADRRMQLVAHRSCHLQGDDLELGNWLTDCDSHPGGAGGPIFAPTPQGPQVAAIMVGTIDHSFNMAVPKSNWGNILDSLDCP